MTNILLEAGVFVLRGMRSRKGPYRGLFTAEDTAVRREMRKVLEAAHISIPEGQILPGHCLLAEASDEHIGLLCGLAARPGPARMRIKKAVHERVEKAEARLQEVLRSSLRDRPRRMAVERGKDKKIVLLDRRGSERFAEYSSPDEPDFTGYYADQAEKLLTDLNTDGLWETAYEASVTAKNSHWDGDTAAIIQVVALDMKTMKGVRESFEHVHRMLVGNKPPPHFDTRERPVEVSVAEAELAYGAMVDEMWRLARRKSPRLDELLRRMTRLRNAILGAFPAYADALETAATESGAHNAEVVGRWLHKLPGGLVKAMAEGMTEMERNFAAAGVFACIEARCDSSHDIAAAPAYARTLGRRSFQRKMKIVLGEDIARGVISAYDDLISALRLRERVAAACRKHGAALLETADDMQPVVETSLDFSLERHSRPKYRKMDRQEAFRQAVNDAVASVLCQEVNK